MPSGIFRLKGRQLYGKGISRGRVHNVREVAERSGMTYSTAHRWINRSNDISGAEFRTLAGFLVDGLNMSPDEVLDMKLGDLFEFVPITDEKATE